MKTYTLYDVVIQLNGGGIIPIGDTHYDTKAYERMKNIEKLADDLINEIMKSTCANEYEIKMASIQKAREEAIRWLKEVRENIDDVLSESEGKK